MPPRSASGLDALVMRHRQFGARPLNPAAELLPAGLRPYSYLVSAFVAVNVNDVPAPVRPDVPPPVRHLRFVEVVHPTPARIKAAMGEVDGVNAKIAVLITRLVGSMWCAYVFAIIALLGLRPALKPGGEGLIAWIAQTFLQLVLLSVIMVGQNVQSEASDARSEHTYNDTVQILDRLDIHTQGGLKDLAELIERLEAAVKPQTT
jgi:hypothetical protein